MPHGLMTAAAKGGRSYLYAFTDRLPRGWRPPSGLGGTPVTARRLGHVVAVCGAVDGVPPAGPRSLACHHDVVASLLDADALVPLHYGALLPAAALVPWIRAHHGSIVAALEAVRGRIEMRVTMLPVGSARPADAVECQLAALAEGLVECAALPRWRRLPARSAACPAVVVAFLLRLEEVAGLLTRIAPVASRAVGVAVVPTGPWPAYSFVPRLLEAATPVTAGAPMAGMAALAAAR